MCPDKGCYAWVQVAEALISLCCERGAIEPVASAWAAFPAVAQQFIVGNMETVAMLTRWLLVGLLCLWSVATQAAFETGSSLLGKCQHHGASLPELGPKAALQLGACYSYLAGVMDVLGLRGEICPRPAVNPPELARIFVGFARMQPPAVLRHPALLFIEVAFERAFPCNE